MHIGTLNPFRYRGYYYDTETELYYLQSRYYNPEWGRFLNADDFQQLMRNYSVLSATHMCNLFAFCNNSVTYVDYTGQASKTANKMNPISIIIVFVFIGNVLEKYNDSIIIKSDINCKLQDKHKEKFKKGKIEINFKNKKVIENKNISFLEMIHGIYEIIGNDIFDILAEYSNKKFYDNFKSVHDIAYKQDKTDKRDFLFSDDCVSNEIRYHFWACWYLGGNKGVDKLNSVADSAAIVDILEIDVLKPTEAITFGYYGGIRERYKNTVADPYYYSDIQKRKNTVREDWKYKKIPAV